MPTSEHAPPGHEALCFLSATDVAGKIRAKDISPVEVVDAVLRRIHRVNPRLNAFTLVQADEAREQARVAEAA